VAPSKAERQPPVKSLTSSSPAYLRQRIKTACPEALDVEIVPSGGANLRIRLKVATAADADRLIGRVAVLPELAGLNPAFDVQVGR
jgi:hypothetical protein